MNLKEAFNQLSATTITNVPFYDDIFIKIFMDVLLTNLK